jgi:hypothetical protein
MNQLEQEEIIGVRRQSHVGKERRKKSIVGTNAWTTALSSPAIT